MQSGDTNIVAEEAKPNLKLGNQALRREVTEMQRKEQVTEGALRGSVDALVKFLVGRSNSEVRANRQAKLLRGERRANTPNHIIIVASPHLRSRGPRGARLSF